MSFAAFIIYLACVWFGPWWLIAVAAFLFGVSFQFERPWLESARMALAGGASWAALAFIKDGAAKGIISLRVARLFEFSQPEWLFALVFCLGAVTVGLAFWSGMGARTMLKR